MTPAEKIAELRRLWDSDWGTPPSAEEDFEKLVRVLAPYLLGIAEAAVARVDAGHSRCPAFAGSKCTCGHDNLAAKLAALGGG